MSQTHGYAEGTGLAQGLLTSILELGAWVGTLINGYLADAVGRRYCALIACVVFTVGVIVQACTVNKDYVLGGRFVTGLGVGSLSMVVPLYNAELSPPEIRGSLVAVQQLAITFGIMISFWIGYGGFMTRTRFRNHLLTVDRNELYRRNRRHAIESSLASTDLYPNPPSPYPRSRYDAIHARVTSPPHE